MCVYFFYFLHIYIFFILYAIIFTFFFACRCPLSSNVHDAVSYFQILLEVGIWKYELFFW